MRSTRGVILAVIIPLAFVGAMSFAHAASTRDVIEVPFEFYRDSIIVQAKIAGQGPFNMLLDTGVDPSVIDIATARSIGLKIAAQGGQGSGSGSETNLAYETSMPLVELGDLKARKVAALASDLSKMSETLGKPLVGVLGFSLLKDRIVQFDYPHRVVRFLREAPRRSSKANDATRTTVSFRYHDEILIDDVTINGQRVVGNLDTGSNATFQMAPATVTTLGLTQDAANGEATSSVGFNGATSNRKGTLRNVTIGTLAIDQVAVVFLGANGGHDEEHWGLRIGNAFLKAYVVTVDYRHHRVTIEAN